jgi:hypothetical protein
LQVPETDASYTSGEYLGTDLGHISQFTTFSYGLYWDINYESNPLNCQWAFISVDELNAARAFYDKTEHLRQLIERARSKSYDVTAEQAVYDNFQSTEEEIDGAIGTLRNKLHYIDFADDNAASIAINRWDDNEDGEISQEEAAAVTSLGNTFRSATKMKSFDELRYFTSLSSIGDEAFRNCPALTSIYIPQNVVTIGQKAFYSCSGLKYIAVLSPDVVDASNSSLTMNKIQLFVPASRMEAYAADATWGSASITEFTGTPVVSANVLERLYGRNNPTLAFTVTGAPINGTPSLSCEAVLRSPVGEYPVSVAAGTITTPGVVLQNSVLRINRTPLTLTAKSYKRNFGEENPVFEFTNSSLRNSEKINDILLQQPVLECDATPESPAGTYEIRISGAETQNYEITYVSGTLTIENPTGIADAEANTEGKVFHDLQGRRVYKPVRGLYIVSGRKVMVK